ncbi:MAG: PAS domain S-box protein [bacterium]|nr:PAS domain S-box protein [bacterium]
MLDSLPGVFYLYDENWRFLRWNKNFTHVTGYSDAEMADRHPVDFFTGPDKELLAQRIQEVFATGKSSVEADFVAKDGHTGALFLYRQKE